MRPLPPLSALARRCAVLSLVLATPLVTLTFAHAGDDGPRVLRERQAAEPATAARAAEAERLRLEAIRFLEEMLREEVEGGVRPEMLLRLADLYVQQGRARSLAEMIDRDARVAACLVVEVDCDPDSVPFRQEESRSWFERAVRLYENLGRGYPRFERADEAAYYLGAAMLELGDRPGAARAFERLIRQHPSSSFAPDALVQLGEYAFDRNDPITALTRYKAVVERFPDSPKLGFALYKLAWCHYNLGAYQPAIKAMKRVIDTARTATGEAARLSLEEDAFRDLVRFYADDGDLEGAWAYFVSMGRQELIPFLLERLAIAYYSQGAFEKSIVAYRRLIALEPSSPGNPAHQAAIVDATRKLGREDVAMDEVDRLLETYGQRSAWARANASRPEAVKAAGRTIEKTLRTVTVEAHLRARALGNPRGRAAQSYAQAYQGYKAYLEAFPEGEASPEMRYNFAELLYKTERWEEAFDEYMAVVRREPGTERGRWCAESAIHAAEHMVEQEGGGEVGSRAVPVGPKSPQPLTAWEGKLVAACRQYAKLFRHDPKVEVALYKSGYLLYHRFRFDEAAEQFEEVIARNPGSARAIEAANLILDAFVVTGDTAGLQAAAKAWVDQPDLGDAAFKRDVERIYENATFKLIEERLASTGDKGAAGEAFERFAMAFPASEQAARALNNASVYHFEVGRLGDAMRVRHVLVDDVRYGSTTPYYDDTLAALGANHESIADFEVAAGLYEQVATRYPSRRAAAAKAGATEEELARLDEVARSALYRAAGLRKALGDHTAALSDYSRFVRGWPGDPQVDDAVLGMARIDADRGAHAEAAERYRAFYIRADGDTPLELVYFARLQHVVELDALVQPARAEAVARDGVARYRAAVRSGGAPGGHSAFVAELMLRVLRPKLERYFEMEITGAAPGAGRVAEDRAMAASLARKRKALAEVQAGLGEVVGTGSGLAGLAAVTLLGRAWEDLADAVSASPVPSYLTPAQAGFYEERKQDQVYAFTERAVGWYAGALERAFALTLYDDDTAWCARRLGALRPDDFPALEEEVLQPRYLALHDRVYDYERAW